MSCFVPYLPKRVSVVGDPLEEYIGRLLDHEFFPRKKRYRRVRFVLNSLHLMRIQPVLRPVQPRNLDQFSSLSLKQLQPLRKGLSAFMLLTY